VGGSEDDLDADERAGREAEHRLQARVDLDGGVDAGSEVERRHVGVDRGIDAAGDARRADDELAGRRRHGHRGPEAGGEAGRRDAQVVAGGLEDEVPCERLAGDGERESRAGRERDLVVRGVPVVGRVGDADRHCARDAHAREVHGDGRVGGRERDALGIEADRRGRRRDVGRDDTVEQADVGVRDRDGELVRGDNDADVAEQPLAEQLESDAVAAEALPRRARAGGTLDVDRAGRAADHDLAGHALGARVAREADRPGERHALDAEHLGDAACLDRVLALRRPEDDHERAVTQPRADAGVVADRHRDVGRGQEHLGRLRGRTGRALHQQVAGDGRHTGDRQRQPVGGQLPRAGRDRRPAERDRVRRDVDREHERARERQAADAEDRRAAGEAQSEAAAAEDACREARRGDGEAGVVAGALAAAVADEERQAGARHVRHAGGEVAHAWHSYASSSSPSGSVITRCVRRTEGSASPGGYEAGARSSARRSFATLTNGFVEIGGGPLNDTASKLHPRPSVAWSTPCVLETPLTPRMGPSVAFCRRTTGVRRCPLRSNGGIEGGGVGGPGAPATPHAVRCGRRLRR